MYLNLKTLYSHLKGAHAKIHFFGLGFIQVKVGERDRYHFYSRELTALVPPEEIHDHRYEFMSTVLKGIFSQEIYSVTPDPKSKYELRYVSCEPDVVAPTERTKVLPELLSKTHFNRGSQYTLMPSAFHRVIPCTDNTITLLQRETKTKKFARVVSSTKEEVCPFSKVIPDDELWAMVQKIIDE